MIGLDGSMSPTLEALGAELFTVVDGDVRDSSIPVWTGSPQYIGLDRADCAELITSWDSSDTRSSTACSEARSTFNAQLQVQQVPPAIVHSHLLAVKVELGKAGRSCGRTLKRPD